MSTAAIISLIVAIIGGLVQVIQAFHDKRLITGQQAQDALKTLEEQHAKLKAAIAARQAAHDKFVRDPTGRLSDDGFRRED